jgi:8-oxo-dGTP diphosphatase
MRRVIETCLCFIRDDENRFLFMRRGKKTGDIHTGKFNAPGGKLEPSESPREAMLREVEEETGLHVTQARYVGNVDFPAFHKDANGQPVDENVHVFLVTGWSGVVRKECAEGDLEWIAGDRVMDLPLWEGDRAFFPLAMQGRHFHGRILYENGAFVRAEIHED